jgi:hypothetical protein
MSGGWVLALVAAVAAGVVGTLWAALFLVKECLKSISVMMTGVVQSLLGQSLPEEPGIVYDGDIGSTSGLFETMPAWQFWDGRGDDPDENPIGVTE